jgi:putative nucleotidyltransferase with HDIG domain
MKHPSVEECFALFDKYYVPKPILSHCKAVSSLATRIAVQLKEKGIPIDVELVRVGGLMHDWMKAVTLDETRFGKSERFPLNPTKEEWASWKELRQRFPDMHECDIAHDLLKDEYPEFAVFIQREGALSKKLDLVRGWEEKVIHYCDWRVLGTDIVSLEERFDDSFKRYNTVIIERGLDSWGKFKETERKAEREICSALSVDAEDLK